MKLIDAIVNFILGEPKKQTENLNAKKPVYLPCNEIFGNLTNKNNADCLDYNYVSADFKGTEIII